jgi:hypothetical protein
MAAKKEYPTTSKNDGDFAYEVSRKVVVPQLKMQDDIAIFVRFDGRIVTEAKVGKGGVPKLDEDGNPSSISTARVVDLRTGTVCGIVAGVGLVSALRQAYSEEGYVGRCFRICKRAAIRGKRFKEYEIDEIKEPSAV